MDQEAQAGTALLAEKRRASVARLREDIPDFDTEERRKKILSVFEARGVPMDEAKSIVDHRIIQLVSDHADAMERLAEYERKEADAIKAARNHTPPASSRPSTRKSGKSVSRKRISDAKAQIKGTRGRARKQAQESAFLTVLRERRK